MKKTSLFLAVTFSFLSSGCATNFEGTKPGAGQPEFSRDFTECQAQANRAVGDPYDKHYIKACMQGKGWNMTKP